MKTIKQNKNKSVLQSGRSKIFHEQYREDASFEATILRSFKKLKITRRVLNVTRSTSVEFQRKHPRYSKDILTAKIV